MYPSDFASRMDMTLLNLSVLYSKLEDRILISTNLNDSNDSDDHSLILACFVESSSASDAHKELVSALGLLEEMGYILLTNDNVSFKLEYRITSIGWLRVEELQTSNIVMPQAFIAMWFDEQMKEAKSKIIEAVQNSGYTPIIIDDKEHNNQIVPEILYEIRQSKFVVEDLTGHRGGVYYEAGYAKARDIEVILTCRKDDFQNRHFDVAQVNTIVWETPADLYARLVKRIESTIGSLRKKINS